MKEIQITKMVASGNDFIIVDSLTRCFVISLRNLAQIICDRKYGVGADGLLVLEKSKVADVRMRIFNPDGSQAEMCGNGARCAALYSSCQLSVVSCQRKLKLQTKAGIIECEVNADKAKIKLTDPRDIKLNIPLQINHRLLRVNFINTGVPHTVVFVEGLDKIDVVNLGRQIRYHKKFSPAGTNVDFVEVLNNNSIKIRTYERGVEDETLACGTGAVASTLITVYRLPSLAVYRKIDVYTKGGEILRVYFDNVDNNFKNIWLEGKARIVYSGVYYVK